MAPPKKKKHTRITRAGLDAVARDVARFVERLFPKGKGQQKRAMAINLINTAVDLPFIGEKTEAHIIGAALDLAVKWLNKSAPRWDR